MQKFFLNNLVLIFSFLLIFLSSPFVKAKIIGEISKLGEAEHLALLGLNTWDYKIDKINSKKIRLRISSEILPEFTKTANKWKGSYLKNIKVISKKPLDGESVITLTLNKNVSYFDYLTDQPSSLVIDFYENKTTTKKKNKSVTGLQANKKSSKGKKSNQLQRKPASGEFIKFDSHVSDINKIIEGEFSNQSLVKKGVFDSSDPSYSRFTIKKKEIDLNKIEKNLKKNVFVNFPTLLESSSQLEGLLADIPLHVIRSKNKTETKEAQLLHRLYKAKSWGAFNKMYEYFSKTYPDSKYKNLLRSLATSTYFNVWKLTNNKSFLEKAENEFLRFQKKMPDSRVTEFWKKVLFYTNLELANGIEAARLGEDIVEEYPLASDLENIKLSLADSYLTAGQFKRAREIYDELRKGAASQEIRKLASFTRPITYIKQKKMNKAVEQYLDFKKEFPTFDEPGYYFNMAEAYFWKGNYYRSASLYKQFIKKYPKHLMNNYAITRIGEIMSLMGLPEKRFSPIYFESVYRFGGLKGADIAQIRLHSLSIPKSKKIEADHYIDEIKKIASKYEGNDMRYFRDIIIADSLTNDKEYLTSNEYLDRAYKENPYNSFAVKIKPRILENIKKQTRSYLDKKDYLSAISLLENNRKSWLSNVKDLDFKRELARSFELAGLDDYALAYFVDYASGMKKEGKELDNQVILSLATLYQKRKDYEQMDTYLKMLSTSNTLSERDKFKTVKLKFEVYDETAAYDRAEKLLKTYISSINKNELVKLESSFLLSDFYAERAQFKDALKTLLPLEEAVKDSDKNYFRLSKKLIKVFVKNGKDRLAMEKADNILKSKEFKQDKNFVFYVGNLFSNNNEWKKAKEIWSMIDQKNGIYAKMINEKLNHKKWKKDYGKFVDRIPAMEGSEKGEY